MFEKKYNIDELYLVKLGYVKENLKSSSDLLFGLKDMSLSGLTYACVKFVRKNGEYVFIDVTNNNEYKMFSHNSSDGDVCVSSKFIKKLRSVFQHKSLKVLTNKLIKKYIAELSKEPEKRNIKDLVKEICKLNKVKIAKENKQNKQTQEQNL